MIHLGFYNTSGSRTHVRFQFTTNDGSGGAVAPSSAFEAADLVIYRAADGAATSATQRSSSSGVTMTSPFDSVTGLHSVDIDLTDNADAGFYASGYQYTVVLSPDTETVDGQTVVKVLAYFEIGVAAASLSSSERNAAADALLGRNIKGSSSTGRTVFQALARLRNKWSISGTTLTVYDTDDTTPLFTSTLTGTSGASPVTGDAPTT